MLIVNWFVVNIYLQIVQMKLIDFKQKNNKNFKLLFISSCVCVFFFFKYH